MTKFIIIFCITLITTVAFAQLVGHDGIYNINQNVIGIDGIFNSTVSASPPPSCTNKLDFSVACNSQYIPLF